MEPVYTPVIGFARALFAAQGLKITIKGTEHVPRHGGAVMAINHTGYFDFTYAGLAGVKVGRYVRFMAKKSIWSNPVAGPLMKGMHHIPVDRDAGLGSFDAARDALRTGEIIGVFPEATISRSFELKAFKSGTVRLAQEAGVPILPTTIWGSQRVWTKGQPRKMGRHGIPLLITVGAPIEVGADEKPGGHHPGAVSDGGPAARRPGPLPRVAGRRAAPAAGPAGRHRADAGGGRRDGRRRPQAPPHA